MKYKIDNKISKRNIRKQGKNIIPLELMKNETNRDRIDDGRIRKDNDTDKDVQGTKSNSKWNKTFDIIIIIWYTLINGG